MFRSTAYAAALSVLSRFRRQRDVASADDLASDNTAELFASRAAALRRARPTVPLVAWCAAKVSHAEADDSRRRHRLQPLGDAALGRARPTAKADSLPSAAELTDGAPLDPARPARATPRESATVSVVCEAPSRGPGAAAATGSEWPRTIRDENLDACTARERECLRVHEGAESVAEVARRLQIDSSSVRDLVMDEVRTYLHDDTGDGVADRSELLAYKETAWVPVSFAGHPGHGDVQLEIYGAWLSVVDVRALPSNELLGSGIVAPTKPALGVTQRASLTLSRPLVQGEETSVVDRHNDVPDMGPWSVVVQP